MFEVSRFILCILCTFGVVIVVLSSHKDVPSSLTIVEDSSRSQDHDSTVEAEDEISVIDEEFIPTNEWKTVKPGQSIPKGLHVRLNIQTGEREAKLLEEDEKEQHSRKPVSRDDLKRALKKFKEDTAPQSKEHDEMVKKKFKSYTYLKEEMRKLEMGIKTDAEIISDLMIVLNNISSSTGEISLVLQDLEYYVHQIDNALRFCDLGGMEILRKILNGSNAELKKEAAAVLASAVQSNPKAQISALEQELLSVLLRLLMSDASSDRRKTYLSAISSLIRHFPYAQKLFFKLGGQTVLAGLFTEDPRSEVLCLKAVTLLHDQFIEWKLATNLSNGSDLERKKQYMELPIATSLVVGGWCERIPTLLTPSQHDTNEKVLTAMKDLVTFCPSRFKERRAQLELLRSEYSRLAEQERNDIDKYYTDIWQLCYNILDRIKSKDEL